MDAQLREPAEKPAVCPEAAAGDLLEWKPDRAIDCAIDSGSPSRLVSDEHCGTPRPHVIGPLLFLRLPLTPLCPQHIGLLLLDMSNSLCHLFLLLGLVTPIFTFVGTCDLDLICHIHITSSAKGVPV